MCVLTSPYGSTSPSCSQGILCTLPGSIWLTGLHIDHRAFSIEGDIRTFELHQLITTQKKTGKWHQTHSQQLDFRQRWIWPPAASTMAFNISVFTGSFQTLGLANIHFNPSNEGLTSGSSSSVVIRSPVHLQLHAHLVVHDIVMTSSIFFSSGLSLFPPCQP